MVSPSATGTTPAVLWPESPGPPAQGHQLRGGGALEHRVVHDSDVVAEVVDRAAVARPGRRAAGSDRWTAIPDMARSGRRALA
ncbi:hypothetical protein ABZ234_26605 [Nocardiopsis sp. NPDC006198]|uniref:hypothetical protein n=1 Tax=Nocardiopsis sp. NPDC006198 TaxID=3154472 RepID=UPI0033A90A67